MNNMDKYLKYLSAPGIFVEVLRVTVGINFLLIYNICFKPDLSSIPNFELINDFSKLFILVSISYMLSRSFLVIANLWFSFLSFLLFTKNKAESIGKNFLKLKEIYAGSPRAVYEADLLNLDVEEYVEKSEYLQSWRSRNYYYSQFNTLLLGGLFTLLFTLEYPVYKVLLLIAIMVLTISLYMDDIEDEDMSDVIANHVYKGKKSK